ncbi:MAG: ABC-F family ATP-binding cassette domain-containing protein [Clostridia bacterium]|nr:ABC-F family ATP-binding cassette domain-containing protein [Clostridia bacterium]
MVRLWLEANNIKVEYAGRIVLDVERLSLYDGERVGLVGENGAGKSTLIKVLSGEITPDAGNVRRLASVSVISQTDEGGFVDCGDMELSAQFKVRSGGKELSGGEKTRRRIAGALSQGAHILLADEPTASLDTEGVESLTKRLRGWKGALILVCHDRALLDDLVDTIWELEDGRVTVYSGNYSDYKRQKEQNRDYERLEYEKYKSERTRLKKSIQRTRERAAQVKKTPGRMGNSEARLHKRESTAVKARIGNAGKAMASRLDHLEEKRRPREDVSIVMRLGANSPIPARYALEASGITLGFERRTLLQDASILLPTGSRTALVGPNGCGKTTLLNAIRNKVRGVYIHPLAKLGVFTQDYALTLDMERTALENVMRHCVSDESTARTVLAWLNIRGDAVFKLARVLSGGEMAKVALAGLLVSDANLLFLDEPTNHMDIFMLEALADMLKAYEGTLAFVSHDRWFIRQVATRIVSFEDKQLRELILPED